MSRGDEKVAVLVGVVEAMLASGSSKRAVVDKLAAALQAAGLAEEAALVFDAASRLWGEPSVAEQIAAYFDEQAAEERRLLDSGQCNNPQLAQERWLVYKASAMSVREGAWRKKQ